MRPTVILLLLLALFSGADARRHRYGISGKRRQRLQDEHKMQVVEEREPLHPALAFFVGGWRTKAVKWGRAARGAAPAMPRVAATARGAVASARGAAASARGAVASARGVVASVRANVASRTGAARIGGATTLSQQQKAAEQKK
jgi:hypothetical protein